MSGPNLTLHFLHPKLAEYLVDVYEGTNMMHMVLRRNTEEIGTVAIDLSCVNPDHAELEDLGPDAILSPAIEIQLIDPLVRAVLDSGQLVALKIDSNIDDIGVL